MAQLPGTLSPDDELPIAGEPILAMTAGLLDSSGDAA